MEIERKYIPKTLPENLAQYKHHKIEQAYLNTAPVVRIRKQDNEYFLTYKGGGMMAREEYNLPFVLHAFAKALFALLSLNEKSYNHLLTKADGNIITKTRYYIPIHNGLTAELDIFEGKFTNMTLVEVEFSSIDKANSFNPPEWFGKDVTHDGRFHNSYLSQIDCCLGK